MTDGLIAPALPSYQVLTRVTLGQVSVRFFSFSGWGGERHRFGGNGFGKEIRSVSACLVSGGALGIRTLDTIAGIPHFECGAFDHSANAPH